MTTRKSSGSTRRPSAKKAKAARAATPKAAASTRRPKVRATSKARARARVKPVALPETPAPVVAMFEEPIMPVVPEPVAPVTAVAAPAAAPVAAIDDFVVDDDTELVVVQSDSELANLFIAEALDHLGTIEAKLLELDERPEDTSLLNDIFRPFHTVKGNASALGIVSVERVAHKVENLLDLARSGRIPMGETEVDLVLRAVDVLSLMINDVGQRLAGQPRKATGAEAVSLVQQVEQLITGQLEGESAAAPAIEMAEPVAPMAPMASEPAEDAAPAPAPAGDEAAFEQDRRGPTPSRRRDDVPALAGTATAIKVDTRKLDNIVDVVGELIVVQSLIQQDPALSSLVDGRLARNMAQLRRLTADLQRNSMALRMVPIRQAFQKVARVVRDISRKAGKPVDLIITGEDTELDRKMVEEITDPLMHMARNSVDHGIEAPDVREANGKPARATVSLSAYYQGSHVIIEVRDDGAGLNTDRILESARRKGLIAADVNPAPEDIHRLIFEAGFSTAAKVTEVSGRGVGMDVVRRNIESLRGRVDIRTERNKGTAFLVRLPLTLAVLDGLLVRVGSERCVLPAAAVRESLRPKPEHVHFVQGQPRMVQVRESVLPLVSLGSVLGMGATALDPTAATVVVVEEGGSRIGLVVEELLHKQEVVVKSLGDSFASVRGVAGGAILGDGRIGLILDPHGIVAMVREGSRRAA
ncbi:MAG TPA: chemotaxis protein CheA [Vicinamibacterales bacterium]|nr:chemotaxis protein CheA [Vicinamibacterales bacterium]